MRIWHLSAVCSLAVLSSCLGSPQTTSSHPQASAAASTALAPPSSDRGSWFGAPRCEAHGLIVCESFEAADLGRLPSDWAPRSGNWGGNALGVSADRAARGEKSLRIRSGTKGAQWLRPARRLDALASEHWGRLFFSVHLPTPRPAEGVLQGDLFEARGPFGRDNTNRVRWGIVMNTAGKHQWIYNVQRDEREFASGTPYRYTLTDQWTCMEWHHSQPEQVATLWLDGREVVELTQEPAKNPEIPRYDDLSVGWANYQDANPELVVYIDEVALHDSRIGCNN